MKKRGTADIENLNADDHLDDLNSPDIQYQGKGLKINLEKAKLKQMNYND